MTSYQTTFDSNFQRPSWPPSWIICHCCYCFLRIWTLRPLFYMNRHFICLFIWKQSWDTLDSNFRRPSWPPSWKICNCCYCFLHIWTLRHLFHMNRHFICLYISNESWDTLDSDFGGHLGRHLGFLHSFYIRYYTTILH